MILAPTGGSVWIATSHTDMRRCIRELALQVQEGLGRDPFAGDVLVFRGHNGSLIKAIWHVRLARLFDADGHHIELAKRDIMLAEGLAAESCLDIANPIKFESDSGPIMLHPDTAAVSRENSS